MSSKYGSLSGTLLTAIGEATGFFEWPIEYSEGWRRKQLMRAGKKTCYETVRRLKKKGLVKVVSQNGREFLALTKAGQLEKLFIKAGIQSGQEEWDGKWRLMIFDIPENVREKRDKLRWLLKRHGFKKLQASVFICPYSLNRQAIEFLDQTGLSSYIRILRVEEIDNDEILRKQFHLKSVNHTNSRP